MVGHHEFDHVNLGVTDLAFRCIGNQYSEKGLLPHDSKPLAKQYLGFGRTPRNNTE